MRIEPLANHLRWVRELAVLLNQEWGTLAPWASVSEVEKRLAGQLNIGQAPFTLIALGERNALLGTASVKLFELPEHRDKKHWLGEVLIDRNQRGQGIGSALIRA